MSNKSTDLTLTSQIRKQIRNRILFCMMLFLIVILIISFFDIKNSFRMITKNIDEESQSLGDYIISQILVKDYDAISIKLTETNKGDVHYRWLNHPSNTIHKQMKWIFPFSWQYSIPLRSINGQDFGYFIVSGNFLDNKQIVYELSAKIILLLFFSIIIFMLIYPLGSRIPKSLFVDPIKNLLLLLHGTKNDDNFEHDLMAHEIKEIKKEILHLIKNKQEQSKLSAFMQIATQVAHDIRSPLTALDIVTKDILNIPEDQRILIRNATNRIHDIANNLLTHYKSEIQSTNKEVNLNLAPELIVDLLFSVISEKRAQYKILSFELITDIDPLAHGLFSMISASQFKRVLSNLLNNSAESVENKLNPLITVTLFVEADRLIIRIQDNGCGIPADILNKIMAGVPTSRKANGHGLGLSYAIKAVRETFQGELKIKSDLSSGTIVDILLPTTSPPLWFASVLNVSIGQTIVILDDDPTIHQVWSKRFQTINLKFINHNNPEDFSNWILKNSSENCMFLIDYEFIGFTITGLDIISQSNIASKSFLTTSRYEESDIRKCCEMLKLRIIPKCFAPYIPIRLTDNNIINADLIFIDDNKALTDAWELHASITNQNIFVFNHIDDFKNQMHHFQKYTPIYIDHHLNDFITGKDFARELYNMGFTHLYLATGHDASHFGDIPWIKGVVGKSPPF